MDYCADFIVVIIVSNNAQIEKLNLVLKAPKNSKSGLCEELGKIYSLSRAQALFLCKKMNEDEKNMIFL